MFGTTLLKCNFFLEQDFEAKNLEVRPEFDTFGSTAAEYARRQATKEIGDRYFTSAICCLYRCITSRQDRLDLEAH